MKVSVIVPVYNRLEHLRALFICLLRQTVPPYELIVSDDGSWEKVEDYIGDLIEKAPFKIKHIYQEDKGFRKTRALNNGVKNSEGDLLVFCDQDLIFSEDHIENIIKNSRKKEFLMGRPVSISENEKNIILQEIEKNSYKRVLSNLEEKYKFWVKDTLKKDKIRRIFKQLHLKKRGIKLVGMSYSLFKEDYISINGYDERYQGWGCEDDDFGNRLEIIGIIGREFRGSLIQIHLFHPFDPTKTKSSNEEYYSLRKKEIFKSKNGICEFGYNNSIDNDKVEIKILK